MFDYNIYNENSVEKFKQACGKISKTFPNLKKEDVLIDVDGTTIQVFSKGNEKITVFNDYDVGAVYVESDIDLNAIF
ncbi:MAG: hypothetical protein ACI4JM_05240 [Oscillospiraceae bacterium]